MLKKVIICNICPNLRQNPENLCQPMKLFPSETQNLLIERQSLPVPCLISAHTNKANRAKSIDKEQQKNYEQTHETTGHNLLLQNSEIHERVDENSLF